MLRVSITRSSILEKAQHLLHLSMKSSYSMTIQLHGLESCPNHTPSFFTLNNTFQRNFSAKRAHLNNRKKPF
ncbi:hypothetical protein CARUB_v10022168mg [Capsella rubella]|uniref:Uncharacterized protein n=1 Tax=Capsella rubella TaxID=81985 RepID=R0GG14_9BRAS|nr:hypothetical protein CARUB_v10022168mg [Capsella rubella]